MSDWTRRGFLAFLTWVGAVGTSKSVALPTSNKAATDLPKFFTDVQVGECFWMFNKLYMRVEPVGWYHTAEYWNMCSATDTAKRPVCTGAHNHVHAATGEPAGGCSADTWVNNPMQSPDMNLTVWARFSSSNGKEYSDREYILLHNVWVCRKRSIDKSVRDPMMRQS